MATGTVKSLVSTLNSKFTNRFETLWTNPNPSQEFAEQKVALNLSSVKAIDVLFRYNTTATLSTSHLAPFSSTRDLAVMANSNGAFAILTREVNWNESGVTFSNCYTYTSMTERGADNTKLIPYKIMAIK